MVIHELTALGRPRPAGRDKAEVGATVPLWKPEGNAPALLLPGRRAAGDGAGQPRLPPDGDLYSEDVLAGFLLKI